MKSLNNKIQQDERFWITLAIAIYFSMQSLRELPIHVKSTASPHFQNVNKSQILAELVLPKQEFPELDEQLISNQNNRKPVSKTIINKNKISKNKVRSINHKNLIYH
jgi:hypothetical protein